MSEAVTAAVSGAVISEDPEGDAGGSEQPSPPEPGPLRCGSCALWPRQQTWLCVVPLLIGFIGLGLSLMLLKWIVVGSVKDYVPTDLVDAKGIGQDPIFLSKPSAFPKNSETTTATTTVSSRTQPGLGSHSTTTASSAGTVGPAGSGSFTPRPPNRISTRITTTTTRTPRLLPPGGRGVTPRGTTVRRVTTGSSAGTEWDGISGAHRCSNPNDRGSPGAHSPAIALALAHRALLPSRFDSCLDPRSLSSRELARRAHSTPPAHQNTFQTHSRFYLKGS
ncbi:UNVERIFIED_CONTAM: hypothetical protein FKN15_028604 [Acipenser sinensis]